MKVIGVAGQMQNGKDSLADYVAEKIGWERDAFAKEVKKVFAKSFGVSLEFIEEWKVKDECPPGFDKPIRQGLQFIGDGFREIQGNIWIELAFRNRTNPVVISDCRYINELKKIRDVGGLNVLIWRTGKENNDPNASEAQIKPVVDWFMKTGREGLVMKDMISERVAFESFVDGTEYVDVFIKNEGTLEDLYKKVDYYVLPLIEEKYEKQCCGSCNCK